MPKLVCLTAGFNDRVFEVKPEKATIGRLDDNSFPISEPSVSSHHCEISAKGDDIIVKDLASTNGTFINETQLTPEKETPLRPGQTLRLGQVELRYETGKRQTEAARPAVKLGETSRVQTVVMTKNSPFAKKTNNTNKIFIAVGAVLVVIIVALLVIAFFGIGQASSTP